MRNPSASQVRRQAIIIKAALMAPNLIMGRITRQHFQHNLLKMLKAGRTLTHSDTMESHTHVFYTVKTVYYIP